MWLSSPLHKPSARRYLLASLYVGVAIWLWGCFPVSQPASAPPITASPEPVMPPIESHPTIQPFTDILVASYAAADNLCGDLKDKKIHADATILAASFVDVNHLEESSTLGRIISEQISSRFAQNGFTILDMKLRHDSIYMKKGQGEFLLSREINKVSKTYNGEFVLVGTYAVAEMSVYVSARIVNTANNSITTGFDFQIERNFQTDSLLGKPTR